MITANEAKKQSRAAREPEAKTQFYRVENEITKAVLKGYNSIHLSIALYPEVEEQLVELGFKVMTSNEDGCMTLIFWE